MASTVLSDNATIGKKQRMKAEPPLDACTLFWSFLLDDYSDGESKEKEAAKKRKNRQKEKSKRRFEPLVVNDENGRLEPSLADEDKFDKRSQSWEFLEGTASTDGEPIVFMSEKQRKEYTEFREWRKSRSGASNNGKARRAGFNDDDSSSSDDDSETLDTRGTIDTHESVTVDTRGREYEDGSVESYESAERRRARQPQKTKSIMKKSGTKHRSKSRSRSRSRGPSKMERKRSDDGQRSRHERNPSPERPRSKNNRAKSKERNESRGESRNKSNGRAKATREKHTVQHGRERVPEKKRPKEKESKSSKWKPSIWRKDHSETQRQSESRPPRPSKSTNRHDRVREKDRSEVEPERARRTKPRAEHRRDAFETHKRPSSENSQVESNDQPLRSNDGPVVPRRSPPAIAVRKVHSFDGVVQSPAGVASSTASMHQPKHLSSPSNSDTTNQSNEENRFILVDDPTKSGNHTIEEQTTNIPSSYKNDITHEPSSSLASNAVVVVGGENSAFSPPRVSPEVLAFKPIADPGEERQDSASRTDSDITRDSQPDANHSSVQHSTPTPAVGMKDVAITTSEDNPYERQTIEIPRRDTIEVPQHRQSKGIKKLSKGLSQSFMVINRVRSGDSSTKSVDRGSLGALRKKKQHFRSNEPFSVC